MQHPTTDLDPQQLLEPEVVLDLSEGTAPGERVAAFTPERPGEGSPPPLDLSNEDEDPDRTGELVIDEHVLEQIRSSNHPAARRIGGQCDPTRSRFASYAECPHCGGDMAAEHAHFRCSSCGWRDSCCD
jgi:hypothetical protein